MMVSKDLEGRAGTVNMDVFPAPSDQLAVIIVIPPYWLLIFYATGAIFRQKLPWDDDGRQ